jgi:hypothetical protein
VTWSAAVGLVSLVCGRVVWSRVASRVYLPGVGSLGVTRFGIALTGYGFVGRAPNDDVIPDDAMPDDAIWAFARSERALICQSPLSRATH